ncbi:MAG: 30S ribosomal protein S9 [Proteobacteria bacterium]|nr:30S ribosomal protein S9 [Pseudomonadota bacterium]NQW45794.1 30S ribosomal protein S9 [Deltaproteobacteria bacterium]
MKSEMIQATGRRKSAVARVRLFPSGDGAITVNERTLESYFPREVLRSLILKPLVLSAKQLSVNLSITVNGSGIAAQAGALSHGISRALLKLDSTLRATLKKEGLLTRDSRMKERKKYGQKGARKRFQFSKR